MYLFNLYVFIVYNVLECLGFENIFRNIDIVFVFMLFIV